MCVLRVFPDIGSFPPPPLPLRSTRERPAVYNHGVSSNRIRYVGKSDFHDGYVRAVSQQGNTVFVTIEGDSRKHYTIRFDGVSSVESHLPIDMMLYALGETDAGIESLRRYEFVNWYGDEPEEAASKSYLRIIASGFTITDSG